MKKKVLGIMLLAAGLCFTAQAASDSWNVDADGSYTNVANWLGGNVPGISGGTASADTAAFSTALTAGRTVTLPGTYAIGTIQFGNTSTNGYTISGSTFRINNGGVIETVAGAGAHNDTIGSAIQLRGMGDTTVTIRNNSTDAGLKISGAISASTPATAHTFTINLDGTSTAGAINGPANGISGIISDGAQALSHVAVVKNGTGTWSLTGANTFAGGLTFNAGTLRYNSSGLSTMFGVGAINVASNGVTFNHANGTVMTLANQMNVNANFTLAGAANTTWSGNWDLNGGTRTLTVNADSAISGVISNGAFTKAGTKILTLSGANTLDSMTVSAGTLLVEGDSSGSGALTVASGATVGGNGTVSDLVLQDGAKFLFDAAATLTANGTSVDLGNLAVASLVGLDGAAVANGTYTLIDGTAVFDFTSVQNLGLANAADIGSGKSAYFQSGSLDLVVIPEPATIGMLGLGALLTIMLRRIRTR
ncbi:MAG: autotransporter-associated beta strand repeat-containing protein [Kiritimatiellales bacterium]|jgi:autotransporter-associated beta strand protein